MKITLYPASKAFIRNKDIFFISFLFSNWKIEWLNFFSSIDVISFLNARSALYFLLKSTKSNNKNEVIISAYTCPTVTESIKKAGYEVVYCDINFETGNISIDTLRGLINKRTHSIITANTYGMIDNVVDIKTMIKNKDIYLFEDITWGIGHFIGKNPIGSFGDASFVSLGFGKTLTVGGGGILLINSKKIKPLYKESKQIVASSLGDLSSLIKTIFYNLITNKYIYKLLNFMKLTPSEFVLATDSIDFLFNSMSNYKKKLSGITLKNFIGMKSNVSSILNNNLSAKESMYLKHNPNSNNYFCTSRQSILLKKNIKQDDFITYINNNGFQATKGFFQVKKNLDPALHINAIKYCDTSVTIPTQYNMQSKELFKLINLI